jgi:hypothetical protein
MLGEIKAKNLDDMIIYTIESSILAVDRFVLQAMHGIVSSTKLPTL